ncbi:hypothetical protein GRI40_08855 [Altererythrobacter aerius]|uniref:Uncharacterized protein n=1 Tax=Tsuneonella aeria TaxID=1837929 RepID=A0A6I4TH28_9SPHN|nr:hypothetical protein [Tsuneonella aeria]MXO75320.1 hypothetical protein [Tsuneonella aeria]
MRLLKSDLYRNIALGFVVGTGLAMFQIAPELGADAVPAARAAPMDAPTR